MADYAPDAVIANFTYSPLLGDKGKPISFSDLSGNTTVNDPCTYEWDWGDGSAHTFTKNATHTYYSVGNYSVVLWVTGSKNLTRSMKVLTVPVGTTEVAPLTCNPSGGSADGIVDFNAPYSQTWTPAGQCIQPYQCNCSPGSYAKYACHPNGSSSLVMVNHPDCCVFCGVNTAPAGAPPTVLPPSAAFAVVDVTVTPSQCTVGESVTATAHVQNSGTAAAAATVQFYWDDGTEFDYPVTTGVINVNTTVATPPRQGLIKRAGSLKLCAVVIR